MSKKKIKTLIQTSILLLPFLLILTVRRSQAQSRLPLVVAPARQSINIDPGKTETAEIKFFNEGTSPVAGNLKAVDFIVIDDQGSPLLLEDENLSSRFSAASWIELPYDKLAIAKETVQKIQFKIKTPEDARPGGRYVAIYFEPTGTLPQAQSETGKEGASAVSSRIVGLVYIRVNGPITETALLKRFEVPGFVEYGPVEIEAEILNRGDYHITPKGQITLVNWFGKEVQKEVLDQKNIFPDASRNYQASLGGKILLGKYKVAFAAAYGESGKALSSSAYFWAFPVRLALIVLLSIIIIILLTVIIWKKIKGRQTKLETKLKEEISEIEDLKDKYKDAVSPPSQPQEESSEKTAS